MATNRKPAAKNPSNSAQVKGCRAARCGGGGASFDFRIPERGIAIPPGRRWPQGFVNAKPLGLPNCPKHAGELERAAHRVAGAIGG